MHIRWPTVPLGELLTKSEETTEIELTTTYRRVTVRLWGQGAVLRDEVDGEQISAKKQWVVRPQQFLISRIDARHGASAIVPDFLDGAIVSNDFPTYNLNCSSILPAYLGWLSKTGTFIALCKRASEGTTNRVRLKLDRFLSTEITLPPLDEQRRIVTRIEELAAKVEQAQELRRQSVTEAEKLWLGALKDAFEPVAGKAGKAESAGALLKKQAEVHTDTQKPSYNNAHPEQPSFYQDGLYQLPAGWVWTDFGSVLTYLVDCINDTPDFSDAATGLLGLKTTNIRPYNLNLSEVWYMIPEDFQWWNRREQPRAGDIILTREAPMGNACILPEGLQVCLTQRLMLLRTDEEFVNTRYILHFINSQHFKEQVSKLQRGMTNHLRVRDVPFINIPLAPLPEQRRIVAYLDSLQAKVEAVKRHQAATAAKLDALLPSILDRAFKGKL